MKEAAEREREISTICWDIFIVSARPATLGRIEGNHHLTQTDRESDRAQINFVMIVLLIH